MTRPRRSPRQTIIDGFDYYQATNDASDLSKAVRNYALARFHAFDSKDDSDYGYSDAGPAGSADDLAQDVFLQFWTRFHDFEGTGDDFIRWLEKVCFNKKSTAARSRLDETKGPKPTKTDQRILDAISDDQSHDEIAASLGWTIAEFTKYVASMRKRLLPTRIGVPLFIPSFENEDEPEIENPEIYKQGQIPRHYRFAGRYIRLPEWVTGVDRIICLQISEGLSYAEIGTLLGLTENAVKKRIQAVRKKVTAVRNVARDRVAERDALMNAKASLPRLSKETYADAIYRQIGFDRHGKFNFSFKFMNSRRFSHPIQPVTQVTPEVTPEGWEQWNSNMSAHLRAENEQRESDAAAKVVAIKEAEDICPAGRRERKPSKLERWNAAMRGCQRVRPSNPFTDDTKELRQAIDATTNDKTWFALWRWFDGFDSVDIGFAIDMEPEKVQAIVDGFVSDKSVSVSDSFEIQAMAA